MHRRACFSCRRAARGGRIDHSRQTFEPILLSPGKRITDPDEAEALGLTADAKRMRR